MAAVVRLVLLVCMLGLSSADERFRIIGGRLTRVKQFRFVVSLTVMTKIGTLYNVDGCTGTIISRHWVVTAAHCFGPIFPNWKPPDIEELFDYIPEPCDRFIPRALVWTCVVAGTVDNEEVTPNTQVRLSNRFFTHPNYTKIYFDVALVQLKSAFRFTKFVGPAGIAGNFPRTHNLPCISMGFGVTTPDEDGEGYNTKLYYIRVTAGDHHYCRSTSQEHWDTHHICVEPLTKNTSTCIGDSGGPLVCSGLLVALLHGRSNRNITLQSFECGQEGNFMVYTHVAPFESWIRRHIPRLPGLVYKWRPHWEQRHLLSGAAVNDLHVLVMLVVLTSCKTVMPL